MASQEALHSGVLLLNASLKFSEDFLAHETQQRLLANAAMEFSWILLPALLFSGDFPSMLSNRLERFPFQLS